MSSIFRFYLFLSIIIIYDVNNSSIDEFFAQREFDENYIKCIFPAIAMGLMLYEIFVMVRSYSKKDYVKMKVSCLVFVFLTLILLLVI